MADIKRGSTFEATIVFSENEWNGIYPWDALIATVGQESRKYPLTLTLYPEVRSVSLKANTTSWSIGPANLDIKLRHGDRVISIPNSYNIKLTVIEGVS